MNTRGPELQDIIIRYGQTYAETHVLNHVQKKALEDIAACRTEDMGAHVEVCPECGYERIAYNSCRNRHCPKCQTFAKEKWIDEQRQNLLNVPYFHVVFTIPAELNGIFLHDRKTCYNLLFKAAAETISELCADEKYLGAKPAVTAVLHTWGQALEFHPYVHMIVSGGGMTPYGTWTSSGKDFFLPVRVLSAKFRGKLLAFLKEEKLGDTAVISACYEKDWNVYCKPPFENAQTVVNYLGRYTHRVAISNNRILFVDDGKITFKWRDYSDGSKEKAMTLDADEFIRRFLLHILPHGLRKIRYYGILAPRDKKERLAVCRRLTRTAEPAPSLTTRELLVKMLGPDFDLCPRCNRGRFAHDPPEAA